MFLQRWTKRLAMLLCVVSIASVVAIENFCGTDFDDAKANCHKPCPNGLNSECDGEMRCFSGTGCSSDVPAPTPPVQSPTTPTQDTENFYCGASWSEAMQTCNVSCKSGLDAECPGVQRCFSATNCFNPIVPMTSNMQISLNGKMDRAMKGEENGTFENTTEAFLKRLEEMGIDLDKVQITDQVLDAGGMRRASSNAGTNGRRRRTQTSSSALDVTVIITGEYRPPPYQNLDVLVQDSINADGQALIDDLQAAPVESDFFQQVESVEAVAVVEITEEPTHVPTATPSNTPSGSPSVLPSDVPSSAPSDLPTDVPSGSPSESPSDEPSASPSDFPSLSPSVAPSDEPSVEPSSAPSSMPSRAFFQELNTVTQSELSLYKTGSFGNIFNVRSAPDSPTVLITSLDFYTDKTDEVVFEVWTREGAYTEEHKGSFDGWTQIANGTAVGAGEGQFTTIPFDNFNAVPILGGGGTRAFYVTLHTIDILYFKGSGQTSDQLVQSSTLDLEVYEGEGVLTYPFSSNSLLYRSPRNFLGTMHYNRWPCWPHDTNEWPCPTEAPSVSARPSASPSAKPSFSPSRSHLPSYKPSGSPSFHPSLVFSSSPSALPSKVASDVPSSSPSITPTVKPSKPPLDTRSPTTTPTLSPASPPVTLSEEEVPTQQPAESLYPQATPVVFTSNPTPPKESKAPTKAPTSSPTEDLAFYMVILLSGVQGEMSSEDETSLEMVLYNYLSPELEGSSVSIDKVDVLGELLLSDRRRDVDDIHNGQGSEHLDESGHMLGPRLLQRSSGSIEVTVEVKIGRSALPKGILQEVLSLIASTAENTLVERLKALPASYFDDISGVDVRVVDKITAVPTPAPFVQTVVENELNSETGYNDVDSTGNSFGIGAIVGIVVGVWGVLTMCIVTALLRKKRDRPFSGKQRAVRRLSQQSLITDNEGSADDIHGVEIEAARNDVSIDQKMDRSDPLQNARGSAPSTLGDSARSTEEGSPLFADGKSTDSDSDYDEGRTFAEETVLVRDEEPETLIGRRLSVRFTGGKFYSGVISSYNHFTKKHVVQFDDGETKEYNLRKKTIRWEEGDDSSVSLDGDDEYDDWETEPETIPDVQSAKQEVTRMIMGDDSLTLMQKRQRLHDIFGASSTSIV